MMHVVVLLAALVLTADPPPPEAPDQPEWWAVDRYVVETLLERDRGEWVRQILDGPKPGNEATLLIRFNVMVRDGRPDDAMRAVNELAKVNSPAVKSYASAMADFLIDREDDALARTVCERLPLAEPGWGYVMAKRWAEQTDLAMVDRWLVARRAAAKQAKAGQPPHPWGDREDYWMAVRVAVHGKMKAMPKLLEELETAVRAQPTDVDAAIDYVGLTTAVNPPVSPQWLLDVVQPTGAYDAHRLGEAMAGPWPGVAATMFERSLALPFNDADEAAMRRLSLMQQREVMGPPQREGLERSLRRQTRSALAQAYKASDQADKAQPLIEALAKESGEGAPPGLAELAGQVQAATGARVIEGRIREAEEAKADTPEYWMERGQYFAGRGEHAEMDAAFEKALQLAPLDPQEPRFKDMTLRRSMALGWYVGYLRQQKREDKALAVIYRELDAADPGSQYARNVVNRLWDAFSGEMHVDNARLWTWLAAQPKWEHLEERVLLWMADHAKPQRPGNEDRRGEIWAKAMPLVKDADPSRATVLGWVMTRHDASDQAAPMLQEAISRFEDEEARQRASFTLFDAYLILGDAKRAEACWPQARRRLGGREIPEWLDRMIDAAERSHDTETVQRLTLQRANLDHRFVP